MGSARNGATKHRASKGGSEVRAYAWIEDSLRELQWNTKCPTGKDAGGQVFTQHECNKDEHLKSKLDGGVPENIIKVREGIYWVIEAKPRHDALAVALKEAKDYANKLNRSKRIKALFVSGVAGSDTDTFLVKTEFLHQGRFVPVRMNNRAITGLLSPKMAADVLRDGPDIQEVHVDERLFLAKAEKINEILHGGGINLKDRATVMSALLLALLEDTHPNVDAPADVLIDEINARSKRTLAEQGKASYHEYVRLKPPATRDNHTKYKHALVRIIQELLSLNIRSAMNSGTDVLGRFYEVFLKYGNGAKDIGIVLTPRHITEFAAEVLNITARDVLYDPCCGTGGFLVGGFDRVRRNSGKGDLDSFKQHNIFGVDADDGVVTLAIVNMIFRGDGKNNIVNGDCFVKHIVRKNGKAEITNTPGSESQKIVTRVLMNPPFPSAEAHKEDYEFVDCALAQMVDGGLLFSVLPYPTLVKTGHYLAWRKDKLLTRNTLLAVVTLPPDLFYPTAATHTLGIIIKKGTAHPAEQNVLWVRAVNDGTRKSKSKRLIDPKSKSDYPKITDMVRGFLINPSMSVKSEEMFYRACPIDYGDKNFELVPEYYLEQSAPTAAEVRDGVESVIRSAASFMVREGVPFAY
jgi:type I restriction enzyme M protein